MPTRPDRGVHPTLGSGVQADPMALVIGAGSVVTPGKHLDSSRLYVGNPARRSRDLTPAEIARIPAMAGHYVALKKEYAR